MRLRPDEEQRMKSILAPFKSDARVQKMKEYVQHGRISTFDHVESVTRLSFWINNRFHLGGDESVLTVGAFLHDYYLYDLAKTWHSLPGTAGPSREALQQIYANDMINNTDNTRVLYWYLVFERKATETGEYLHMHRNSVLYRIERLEEQYNLNLDNYQTRIAMAMELAWLALNDSATVEKEEY